MPLPRPALIEVRSDAVVLTREAAPPSSASLRTQGLHEALTGLIAPVRDALRADVLVNAMHTRLLVLPSAAALTSEARWLAYAASRFEDVFGDGADGWSLRLVPERPQRPRLLAALPMVLMRTLDTLLGQRLRSVRIDTLVRVDELRLREPDYTGALVDIGAGHAVIALLLHGTLHRVRLRHMAPDLDELRAALRVEWAALGRFDELPALAIAPPEVLDASDATAVRMLAARIVRLA